MIRPLHGINILTVVLFMNSVSFSMEKTLNQIDECDRKIKEKEKQLENISSLKIFKKNSDQKSVALLKSRIKKEIELYNSKKEELVLSISKL